MDARPGKQRDGSWVLGHAEHGGHVPWAIRAPRCRGQRLEGPLLQAHPQGEDQVLLVLDLGAEFSTSEAERVIPFLADAIAVALGYGCHPRDTADELHPSAPVRPRRVSSLIGVSTDGGSATA